MNSKPIVIRKDVPIPPKTHKVGRTHKMGMALDYGGR